MSIETPQRKTTHISLGGVLAVIVALLLLVGLYWMFIALRRGYRTHTVCGQNVEYIQMALAMYTSEWGSFPDADRWVDQLLAWEPSHTPAWVFKCPEDPSDARSSYGMNRSLAGIDPADILNADHLVSVYETQHPGDNPSGGPEDVASPPRHYSSEATGGYWLYKGNNYGYACGMLFGGAVDLPRRPTFEPELASESE